MDTEPTIEPTQVTVKALIFGAAQVGKMHPRMLRGPGRERAVVRIRQAAQYLARERLGCSLSETGRRFYRDHATVMHACRCVRAELERAPVAMTSLLADIWAAAEVYAKDQAERNAANAGKTVDIVLATTPPAPIEDEPAAPPPPAKQVVQLPPELRIVPHPTKYQQFTPEWWLANDLSFRQGLTRAYRGAAA